MNVFELEKFIYGVSYHITMVRKVSSLILEELLKKRNLAKSIKQISESLKIDYKNTFDSIKKISDSLNIKKIGNSNQITVSSKLTPDIFLAETNRKESLLSNSNIKMIYDDLNSIKNPFFVAIVFGSYAKKDNNINSDIDLCIICDSSDLTNKIKETLGIYPFEVDLQVFTSDEFISMIKTKEFNIAHEIATYGVVLKNIESYYEVLKFGF